MKKALVTAVAGALAVASVAGASHNPDDHSPNMRLVANFNDGGAYSSGTDIAFWNDVAVAGNSSPGGFRLLRLAKADDSAAVFTEIAQFDCNSSQSDVSIWKTLVFVSVDGPRQTAACDSPSASQGVEGIRVVDVGSLDNPQPRQNLGSRGFDAFHLDDRAIQRDAVKLGHLNPQTMEVVRGRS